MPREQRPPEVEHGDGKLLRASTGWMYVQCACGWRSARQREPYVERCWGHYENHCYGEAEGRKIRDKIWGSV